MTYTTRKEIVDAVISDCTTASHIAKFRDWIRYKYCTGWNWPKIVRLYNDSRTGKRAAKKNLEDDFASVISIALNQPRYR